MLTNRKGFTLIELLIVVVIIGILAAIAIPKFANTKEKAYVASMKSDLRNLVTAQEAYFSDNNSTYAPAGTYTAGTTNGSLSYKPSSGVTVTVAAPATTGWSATSSHASTAKTCSMTVGGTSSREGEPVCN